MPYHPDLTPMTSTTGVRYRLVGWLGPRPDFPTGPVPAALLPTLWRYVPYKCEMYMGVHACDFCGEHGHREDGMAVGNAQIWIFHASRAYFVPDMIIHYISKHHYRPPDEFIDAVLHGAQARTHAYHHLLRAIYLRISDDPDEPPPLQLITSGLELPEPAPLGDGPDPANAGDLHFYRSEHHLRRGGPWIPQPEDD
jgi:hypothetical protein